MANEQRVERATLALESGEYLFDSVESALIDILTDLRHFSSENGGDFEKYLRISEHHFEEEEEKNPIKRQTEALKKASENVGSTASLRETIKNSFHF